MDNNNEIGKILRYVFNNNETLFNLLGSKFPDIIQVKRMVLLEFRNNNRKAPDHLYRMRMEEIEHYFVDFSTLFLSGIGDLSSDYIEFRDNKLFVVKKNFFNWQETITMIPPSFFIASKISKIGINEREKVWKDFVLPNTIHTMLLSPHIIQLKDKVEQWGGLDELHIHLNGSLEVDKVWQDFLQEPAKIKKYLDQKDLEKPKEQFSQEGFLLNSDSIFEYLCIAKEIRKYFFDYFQQKDSTIVSNYIDKGLSYFSNKESLLKNILEQSQENWSTYEHPFSSSISKDSVEKEFYPSLECWMFVKILDELRTNKDELLAEFLYLYMLIYGLVNRLLVHQLHQNGFEQFQKITLNELREFSEATFDRRFKQFAGNDLNLLKFIEGRVAPKKSSEKWIKTFDSILKGWKSFQESSNQKNTDLKLIVHFIKRIDKSKNLSVRYYDLRKNLYNQGMILRGILRLPANYSNFINGIDAASSEFDTPPEVFGPLFRLMRNSGIKHFTYHAGEDFFHIVTGMRAIYEAILFCGLTHGDRIGHAVALGLDAIQWGKTTGSIIKMKQGDYLDDLVFLYYVIKEYKLEQFYAKLNLLKSHAEHLYFEVYNVYIPIETVVEGWKIRGFCPIHLGFNGDDIKLLIIPIDSEKEICCTLIKNKSKEVIDVYRKYHSCEYRNNFDKKITVNLEEFVAFNEVEMVQKSLLEMMNRKEIVIETLPMSNVRIGFHQDFSTYHLWNWIKWKKEGVGIPPIIIGSDDTGIFATNIYNEYANVYLMFIQYYNLSHTEAMTLLEEFKKNGDTYKFK